MKKLRDMLKEACIAVAAVCFLTGCANYVQDGAELLEQGKYQQAVEAFEMAIQQAEQDKTVEPEAYRGLGIAYYNQKEFARAQENLQKALDMGAKATPVVYNMMGICKMQQEDYEGALASFTEGIALKIVQAEGEAAVDYSETIREMRFNCIVCYEQLRDWENAKTVANEYIKEYPEDAEAQREVQFLETR